MERAALIASELELWGNATLQEFCLAMDPRLGLEHGELDGPAAIELDAGEPLVMAEAVAAGYVAEVGAMDAGRSAATAMAAGEDHGEILNYILRKAAEDGAAREELGDYTRVMGERREMFFGEVEPPVEWESGEHALAVARDEVTAMSAAEMHDVAQLVAQWPTTLVDEIGRAHV